MRLLQVTSAFMKRAGLVSPIAAVFFFGCSGVAPIPPKAPIEQDLRITFGGFLQGGDERQKIDGVCNADDTRSVFNCDIYNGLPNWLVTELVIRITWAPYSHGDVRDYRERVSIPPLTTASLNFRLGMQLPDSTSFRGQISRHWDWLVVGAKAIPAQLA